MSGQSPSFKPPRLPVVYVLRRSCLGYGLACIGDKLRWRRREWNSAKVARIFGGDQPNIMWLFSTLKLSQENERVLSNHCFVITSQVVSIAGLWTVKRWYKGRGIWIKSSYLIKPDGTPVSFQSKVYFVTGILVTAIKTSLYEWWTRSMRCTKYWCLFKFNGQLKCGDFTPEIHGHNNLFFLLT